MVVKSHGYHLKCADVYMDNSKLEYGVKAKYLGVIICNDLKEDEAMLRHSVAFMPCQAVSLVVSVVSSSIISIISQLSNCILVNNSIDNFHTPLPKHMYGFRHRVCDIKKDFIKRTTSCINIVNGPMWFS